MTADAQAMAVSTAASGSGRPHQEPGAASPTTAIARAVEVRGARRTWARTAGATGRTPGRLMGSAGTPTPFAPLLATRSRSAARIARTAVVRDQRVDVLGRVGPDGQRDAIRRDGKERRRRDDDRGGSGTVVPRS